MKRLFGVLFNTKGLAGVALGFITSLAPSLALADELNSMQSTVLSETA